MSDRHCYEVGCQICITQRGQSESVPPDTIGSGRQSLAVPLFERPQFDPQPVVFREREREFARVLRDMRVVLQILNVRPSSDGLYHITVPRGTAVALSGTPAASTSHDAHIGTVEGFLLFEPVDPLRVPSRQY